MKTISESRRTMHSKLVRPLLLTVCAGLLSWSAPEPVGAATFPARGDDNMSSMGVFRVAVAPPFRSLMEPGPGLFGYPGYVSADGRLTSPKLLDFSTIVGRSDPHNRPLAGPTAIGNPSMGNFGYGDYPIIPFAFAGAPAGTREILTRIRNLALNTFSQECSNHLDPRVPSVPINHRMVYAGPMQGVAQPSLGMVQELMNNGAADPDFPARSFFDVFVEVNLPAVPMTVAANAFPPGGAVLYNDLPLIVSNTNVTSLPPQVVYIHGESTAVPLRFRDNNAPYWNAGDIFGYLVLAGHGTDTGCPTAEEQRALLDVVLGPIGGAPANEMPIEWEVPTDQCPPPNAAYDSVKVVDIIEFRSPTGFRVQARNFSHTGLDNPIMPPPLGGTANYSDAATQIDGELSTDGGSTWFMAQAMGGVNIRMHHEADSGGVGMFDTEIVNMTLTGNSPAGPFRLRESPARASLGRHTIRPTGGSYLVSSFFDVALELSVDNGQNWIPANRPIRVQLVSPCETNPPTVIAVSADCDLNRITVQFSEPMDPVSAGNAGNYTLGSAGSVTGVALSATGDSAVLTTIDLACDKQYTLSIRGVKDKCGNTIAPNPTTHTFVCPPCKVAKWSQLPGFIVFPTSPNRHGEDRPSNFDWQGIMEGALEPNQVIAEDFRSDGRPILCVRWWGSYMPGFEPKLSANSFFEDGYVLSFFSSLAGTPAGRPDKLLGTYVAPLSAIKITPTRYIGCDSNRIWQYEVMLKDMCLEHADPEIATSEAFLEQRGVVYWLSIAAQVGHRVIPLIDSDGNIVKWEQEPTGKRADRHFWGWHTSPRFELEVSMNGNVLMEGIEWIYPPDRWQPNRPLCNELDQAFELLTQEPPCETNRPTVIAVDVDCDTDTITVSYSEAMDPATAGSIGNYGLSGAGINSVSLNAAGDVATLKTDDLKCDGTYEFSVRSVTDLCTNVINPNPQFFTLQCPPCPEPKVSKWSQLPGEFIVGTTGAPRGADRPSDFDWVTLMQSGTTIGNPNWVVAEDFRSDGRPILCVRWWGSYMPGFEPSSPFTAAGLPPQFFEDGYVLSFFSDLRPAGGGQGRPDQLLGTYIAPLSAVKITRTQFIGCDQLPIWQYEVALEDTCLEHASALATPRAFLERSNIVYWLAITAEVGLRVVPTTDPAGNNFCRKELTGKRADRHFWGWHTTIAHRESTSVMGHVFMPGQEWIYPSSLWMPNQPLCNQIAQSFELLTLPPPCETNPPTVISVTADCDSNKVTVVYSEPMDPGTAGSLANYFSGPGYMITSVMLNAAGDTAMLFTSDLVCGTNYTLTIRGVRDLCTNTINPNPQTFTFVCPPCEEPKEPKFSQLPGYLMFPTSPHQRGANRPSNFDWRLIMNDTVIEPNAVVADDWVSNGQPILCVRWWGSYFRTNYEPVTATSTGGVSPRFFEDGYALSFFSGFIGGINRPEKLLGTYVAPMESVKVSRTPFFGCDGHRIYQYEVALKDTCLDHAFASIARPSAFLERPRGYYFLSIAAQVGHDIIPLRNNQGVIVDWAERPNNKRATEHFWGWHTSPSNSFDFSVTGNLLMPGTEWVYERWLINDAICNERSQAFELLTGPLDCGPRPTLSIVRSGDNVVLSWVGTGYTLQATSTLTTPEDDIAWTDLTTTSPVTLPIIFTQNLFFRLICP